MARNGVIPKLKKVTHVIFDLDGTLLDTEFVYRNSIANIAKRFGKTYTSEIAGKVIGTVERESSRIAVTEMNLPMSVPEFQKEFRTQSFQHFIDEGIHLLPGAERMVKHLHKNKIPLAVATSSSQEGVEIKIGRHKDFFKLFSHIVCAATDPDVKEGKPKPDVFLVCASRFSDKPNPEKCLVFEDAPTGIYAAIAAGMQVILVPDKTLPEHLREGATLVIKSLDQMPLAKFGLPPLK